MIGTTIAHYKITAKLGEGGMGEVYRATDDRLNRDVAIKLLPDTVQGDPTRLARFRREAQVLASLTHGNIAQIYGMEEHEGQHAIVLELVEGEDLSERIARGALPPDDVREIALQIAEALETAHEKGIVHRDLKPANIKLAPDGTVKVLDFGLAKALESEPGSDSGVNLSASPTVTSAQTRDGVILGTAAYMSPEQARGKAVDRRADIWAFGCVMYEMLTARTAFAAETVSDTLVAVLSGEADLEALPATTPAAMRRLIERCLTRDARRRLRDIGEARILLEDLTQTDAGDVATGAETAGRPSSTRWALLVLGAAVGFAAGWLLHTVPDPKQTLSPDRRIQRLTYEQGLEQEPTLSPDGNYVAYSTDRDGNLDIEILPLAGGSVTRITDHPADDAQPRWSPDGTRLAFVSARDREAGLLVSSGGLGANSGFVSSEGGDLFLIPALGGTPTKLIDRAAYPTWSPDGNSIAFQSNRDGNWRIWRVPAAGGDVVQLTSGDDPARFDFQPAWSPDGRWIACAVHSTGEGPGGLFVVPADGGEPLLLIDENVLAPAWTADGKYLVFSSQRTATEGILNLWRLEFDPGNPDPMLERVTLGTKTDIGAAPSTDGRRLAFSQVLFAPDIWSLDVATGELEQLTATDDLEDYPHLNPDGRRLLFESNRSSQNKLWVKDLVTGELEILPMEGTGGLARWSPDGTRVVYGASDDDTYALAIQRWGDASRETMGMDSGAATAPVWSPDGTRVAGSNASEIWFHAPGEESTLFMKDATFASWSPDGQRIAFQRDTGSDHREIWVAPVEGGEPRKIVGGEVHYSHPQWHPIDEDRILIVIDHKDLGILRVSTGEMERITDIASSTVQVDYPSWSADGKTIYFSIARKSGDLYLIEE